jgi:hypothetical protein
MRKQGMQSRAMVYVLLSLLFCAPELFAQKKSGFSIVENKSEKRVDVQYNKKHITSFVYFDSLLKTAYYPISTLNGTHITREYPYVKKAGERTDHPHHVGMFFAHQSVNDHDFWNMSTAIAPEKRNRYGKQVLISVTPQKVGKKSATIVSKVSWQTYDGQKLLNEETEVTFSVSGNDLIIDRRTILTALTDVTFKDEKDALLGLRVARELELPVDGKDRFVMADGSATPDPIPNDVSKVTGNYRNSESAIGEAVWGKKAAWVALDGKINGKDISLAILDNPSNVDYPSYWHARGYGLFAVNPLGKKVFSEGKATLDLKLAKDQSTEFKYRIVIREGSQLTPAELNQYAKSMTTK